jgi:hypothetical protein
MSFLTFFRIRIFFFNNENKIDGTVLISHNKKKHAAFVTYYALLIFNKIITSKYYNNCNHLFFFFFIFGCCLFPTKFMKTCRYIDCFFSVNILWTWWCWICQFNENFYFSTLNWIYVCETKKKVRTNRKAFSCKLYDSLCYKMVFIAFFPSIIKSKLFIGKWGEINFCFIIN